LTATSTEQTDALANNENGGDLKEKMSRQLQVRHP